MTDYQKYQLQWMIDHGHSLDELIDELDRCQMDWADTISAVSNIFKAWENDVGFGNGSIYLCEREWQMDQPRKKMTVKELLQTDEDIDVYDDICEELNIAVCCPLELTPEGEKEFKEVLDYEVEINPYSYGGYPAAILLIDQYKDWKDRLDKAERFFYAAAGYCDWDDYERWFV